MKPHEIRNHLLLAGTNGAKLAEQLGVKKQAVYAIISGVEKYPSRRIAQAISDAVGIPVAELWPEREGKR